MGIFKEFKEFAVKGNVVDLAVAVVLGAAFGNVVSGVTDSIIAPILALIVGKVNVADLKVTIGTTVFPVGILFQAIVDFILIALVLFGLIKAINTMNRKKEMATEQPPTAKYTHRRPHFLKLETEQTTFDDNNSVKRLTGDIVFRNRRKSKQSAGQIICTNQLGLKGK